MPTPIEKIFEDVQLHVKFTQAGSRSNIVTYDPTDPEPENISTAFGKLSTWFNGLVPAGGSSGQFLGWSSDGVAQWVNNPNVDTKVTQQSTSSQKYRPILFGYTEATSPSGLTTTVTNKTFVTSKFYVKPSSGEMFIDGTLQVSNSSYGPLTIKRTTTANAGIRFENNNGFLGSLGIGTVDGVFKRYLSDNSTYYTILDTGNTSVTTTGSGNAITSLSFSNGVFTADTGNTSFLTEHPTIILSADTTSTPPQLSHGGTFTAITSVTREENGHVTKINTATYTLPSDQNTDTLMTQTNTTASADYRVLLSGNANDTTETTTGRKSTNLRFNPSSGGLYSFGFLWTDITGQTLDINTLTLSDGTLHSRRFIEKTDGGAGNITNIPAAGKPFILEVDLIRWASTTDYITRQRFTNAANGTYSYVRYCTNGTWGNWTTRKYTDTNTKVTSVANHYTPATASGGDISESASGATAAWGIDVVQGVTLNTDGKGHVTGISVTSGKIPTNPVPSGAVFTDQKVRQSATTTEDFRPILMGETHVSGSSTGLDATVTGEAYVSTKLYCQPKTGNLYVGGGIKYGNNTLSLWSGNDCAGVSQRNNYDINTWYGFSVSNACTTTGTLNKVAFSVNARNGQAWHTGNLHLYSASGDSPALVFQRGTFVDDLNDWKIYVSAGTLYFAQSTANASSETWTNKMYFHGSDGNLYVGSTKVSLEGHTHNYAGSSSAGGPATNVAIARVTKDSKVFPGANKVVFEEYTNGTTYNLPSNHWYHIMSAQGNDTKYGTQLALGMTTTAAYYRVYNNQTWSDWKSLINTNTTYSANNGVGLSGTTFYNSGVRAVSTGSANGTISVNTNGTSADVAVKGLASAAYVTQESLLRARSSVTTDGGATGWAQIGINQYNAAYPDGVTNKIYSYGAVVSMPAPNARFDLYYNHNSSTADATTNGLQYRTGWNDDKKAWRMLIDNVNYTEYMPYKKPIKFQFNNGITNGYWAKLFSANYSDYNILEIDIVTYHGYDGNFRSKLHIRFTRAGFIPGESSIISHQNIAPGSLRITQDDTNTFSLWIKCDGISSRFGYEILNISDESSVFFNGVTLTAARWSFPTTFTKSDTAPTNAVTATRYFALDNHTHSFTDPTVTQTADNSSNSDSYELLISNSANNTTETAGVRKSTRLRFNPSTGRVIMQGPLIIRATDGAGSYDEGIRINAGKNGFSSLSFGGGQDTISGTADGQFWVGTNSTNDSFKRKLYIAHASSTGSGTYFYVSSATQVSPALKLGTSGSIADNNGDAVTGGVVYTALSNYLPLSGGSLSGPMNLKSTTYDGSAANNGVSSGIAYPTTFNILDKSSRILVRLEGLINSSGSIGSYWYVRNYNTSGTSVGQKGISMTMAKDGTLTYGVDDGAKFRSAIGAGTSNLTIGTTSTTAAAGDHGHGLLHSDLTQAASNVTTGGWSVIGIDPAVTGYVLKSIRINEHSPNWLSGNYGAGIAFGGYDTKGVISMNYHLPAITFAGGNHSSSKTEPVWYLKISGTSGSTYNLDNLLPTSLLNVTESTNLGLDGGTNAFGYVSGLTKDTWNFQQTDGTIIRQYYSAIWKTEIFMDYRTGQMSTRGKNNGEWQGWRIHLDSENCSSYTFKVTRGSSVSTATSGYWAAMCNSTQTGSPVLPTAGKWWHVISMDWTNDVKNWISQLAIATQDGSGVWWRRNDTGGTTIDSFSWHRLAEGNSSGAATNVATEVGSSAGARPVFFAYLGDNTRVVYNTNFTYNPSGNVLTAGIISTSAGVNANTANSSTAGGLSLYSTNPDQYGVIFRGTSQKGKHGYVTSDWATYFTMNDSTTRGWVFNRNASSPVNVASISGGGNAVFNGSVTVGGNAANTSGCRLTYNSSTQSLDFIFA